MIVDAGVCGVQFEAVNMHGPYGRLCREASI